VEEGWQDQGRQLAACRTAVFSRVATSVISSAMGKLAERGAGAEGDFRVFEASRWLCARLRAPLSRWKPHFASWARDNHPLHSAYRRSGGW
jgi:hypothetical protein